MLKPQLLVVVSFIISRNSFVRFDKQVSGQARLDQPVTVAIRRNTICQITGAYRYEKNAPNNDLFFAGGCHRIRLAACVELAPVTPEVVPTLIEILKNKDSLVSNAAAEALGSIGPAAKDAISLLAEARNDTKRRRQVWLRPAATEALARIDPRTAAEQETKY